MVELTPIDEEPSEADEGEDQPITMIPKIMHTAPSPTVENPQPTIASIQNGDQKQSTVTSTDPLIENSAEQPTVVVQQPNENGNVNSNNKSSSAINGNASEKEISQIESVL